jgi:hypothetical protein
MKYGFYMFMREVVSLSRKNRRLIDRSEEKLNQKDFKKAGQVLRSWRREQKEQLKVACR